MAASAVVSYLAICLVEGCAIPPEDLHLASLLLGDQLSIFEMSGIASGWHMSGAMFVAAHSCGAAQDLWEHEMKVEMVA